MSELLIILIIEKKGWVWYGFYIVIQGGDLFYIDRIIFYNIIKKRIQNNRDFLFIEIGDWRLLSLYFFCISEDILVGMRKGRQGKVVRYIIDGGIEKQVIRLDNENDYLYMESYYIIENIKGDVCI